MFAVLRNVALGKEAYQTGVRNKGYAKLAVDGILTQTFQDGSCTHTDSVDASWEVDLGTLYEIDHVAVYNREGHASEYILIVSSSGNINQTYKETILYRLLFRPMKYFKLDFIVD